MLDSSVVLDLTFALRTRGNTETNVKSTTLGRRSDIGLLHGVTNLRVATKDQKMAGVRFGKPDLLSPVWHEATVKVTSR
jgi:hypothetical protein